MSERLGLGSEPIRIDSCFDTSTLIDILFAVQPQKDTPSRQCERWAESALGAFWQAGSRGNCLLSSTVLCELIYTIGNCLLKGGQLSKANTPQDVAAFNAHISGLRERFGWTGAHRGRLWKELKREEKRDLVAAIRPILRGAVLDLIGEMTPVQAELPNLMDALARTLSAGLEENDARIAAEAIASKASFFYTSDHGFGLSGCFSDGMQIVDTRPDSRGATG